MLAGRSSGANVRHTVFFVFVAGSYCKVEDVGLLMGDFLNTWLIVCQACAEE